MESDIDDRTRKLIEFGTFIDDVSLQVNNVLQSVGWSREHLVNEDTSMVPCPHNSKHLVPIKSLDVHISKCIWKKEGYHEKDIPLPENPVSCPEQNKSCIVVDASLQGEIIQKVGEQNASLQTGNLGADVHLVPKTSDRLMSTFTADERRVLYEYAISKTRPVEDVKIEDLQMIDGYKRDEKPRAKSRLELLIEERDAKRRRISYKKKVHTNRKSHTEIMREVIQNQMEVLEQIIKGDCEENKDDMFNQTYVEPDTRESAMIHNSNIKHLKSSNQEVSRGDKCYSDLKPRRNRSPEEAISRRYCRSDIQNNVKYENSRVSRWNENERNYRERRYENKHASPSSSVEAKPANRYYQQKSSKSESYRYYRSSFKEHHAPQRDLEGHEKYSHSRHHRNFQQSASPELTVEQNRKRYQNRHKNDSGHDYSENDSECEGNYYSRSKPYSLKEKSPTDSEISRKIVREEFYDKPKCSSREHDHYMLNENENFQSFKNKTAKRFRSSDAHMTPFPEMKIMKNKLPVEENIYSKSVSGESKHLKKKKKKKHHKHKAKKKCKKRKHCSSSSLSSSVSCSEDSSNS